MFDAEASRANNDSPESAYTLYKCRACGKLLTKTLEKKLKCIQSRYAMGRVGCLIGKTIVENFDYFCCRMLVGRKGGLIFVHERDPSWDANDYLVEMKAELKTWREVYWRLWGTVNYQTCSR